MGGTIMILGASFGFSTAVLGYFFLEFSLLTAFLIWALSGPLSAAVALLRAARADPDDEAEDTRISADPA